MSWRKVGEVINNAGERVGDIVSQTDDCCDGAGEFFGCFFAFVGIALLLMLINYIGYIFFSIPVWVLLLFKLPPNMELYALSTFIVHFLLTIFSNFIFSRDTSDNDGKIWIGSLVDFVFTVVLADICYVTSTWGPWRGDLKVSKIIFIYFSSRNSIMLMIIALIAADLLSMVITKIYRKKL